MEGANYVSKVSENEFCEVTNTRNDGHGEDDAAAILVNCNTIIEQRDSEFEQGHNNHNIQGDVMRGVRGEGRPGRVRGMGLGPTPGMIFGLNKYYDAYMKKMDAKVEELKNRRSAFVAEIAEMKAMLISYIAANNIKFSIPPNWLETANNGSIVGEIKYNQVTNTRINGPDDDVAAGSYNCDTITEQIASEFEERHNNHDLQEEIVRDVRGEEGPGRVGGLGLGPSPLTNTMEAQVEEFANIFLASHPDIGETMREVLGKERPGRVGGLGLLPSPLMIRMKAVEARVEELTNEISASEPGFALLRATIHSLIAGKQSE